MKNLITSISSKKGAEFRFYHGNDGEYADMYAPYFIYSIIWSTCALWILSSPAHSYTYCCLVSAPSNSQCGSLFLLVSLLSCGLIAQKTAKVKNHLFATTACMRVYYGSLVYNSFRLLSSRKFYISGGS